MSSIKIKSLKVNKVIFLYNDEILLLLNIFSNKSRETCFKGLSLFIQTSRGLQVYSLQSRCLGHTMIYMRDL